MIRGRRRIRFREEDRTAVFDLAFREGIRLGGERRRGDLFESSARSADAERLFDLLTEAGIGASLSEPYGLPALFRFCVRRPGIPVGLLAAFVWMVFTSGLVWDIRIEGNRNVPDEEVEAILAEQGFGIGTRYGGVNFDQLQADCLASQNELAWLSVYMDGTVARVQVWEMRPWSRNKHPDGMGANVIAAEDGVVEEIRVYSGEAAARAGDVIRAGEVAISGVMEKKDGGVRFAYAEGEVLVTTVRALSAEVPFRRTEIRPTGAEKRRITLKIFKKKVKLFENSGFDGGSCDTIDTIGQVCLFGRIRLPVWIGAERIRETEPVEIVLTPEEAEAEAKADLRRQIRDAAADGQIAGEMTRMEVLEDRCRADAVLYITRDVGVTVEFPIGPAAEEPGNG